MSITVEAEVEPTVVIRMPASSARLLAALCDFPNWDAQTPEVTDFLAELYGLLAEEGYANVADGVFTNSTSMQTGDDEWSED